MNLDMMLNIDNKILNGEIETEILGYDLAKLTPPGGTWILYGELGVGKTTFVRGFIGGLGGNQEDVTSPTYSIMHRYQCEKKVVYHLDLYRIGVNGSWSLGLEDILKETDYLLVEWGDSYGPWPTKWVASVFLNGMGNNRSAKIIWPKNNN